MASWDHLPFRDYHGQLDPYQSILLQSCTQERMTGEVEVCYHFRRLFDDYWLPPEIALVQARSINPPILLLKPFKPNSADGSFWDRLRSYLNRNGQQFGWTATVRMLPLRVEFAT